MNRSVRISKVNRDMQENKENDIHLKRKEQKELAKKIEVLNALENEIEDALFNAIELRENVTAEATKMWSQKLDEEYKMLLESDIELDVKPVPQEKFDEVENMIKVAARKTRDTAKMQEKIEKVASQKMELIKYVDEKLAAISNIFEK